ncbi:MAG: sigma 54-interacting transcriptional regulator [Clostridia bacterium]|jgi:PAS domain S-box-containing protein|nr:sigma 54-interacting transcriptional regulator [Clostridiales bacterium]
MPNRELEVILNSTRDAIVAVNRDGIITIFNKAAERLMGVRFEDALGKPILDVVDNSRLSYVLETGKAELNREQPFCNTRILTNCMPVRDGAGDVIGAVEVSSDIGEIKQLAEQITNLKEIQSMLEAIFHSTQDAISVVDQHGMGVMVNPAYTRLTGLSEKDVIGKPATVDIAEGESIHFKVLETRKPIKSARLKVGPSRKEVIVDAAPIVVDGELRGSVGVIHDISGIKKLTEELNQAKQIIRKLEAKYTFDDIVSVNHKMQQVIEKAKKAAQTPATVLLQGASGTGKELFAHAIHNASGRRFGQFVRVNCAALSESLLESELFGYEEGAFTGAKKGGKKGLFEVASGGTIFLDEIGEINSGIQAKLLRVLHEKEIIRVGGTNAIPVDVRIISATNIDLEEAMQQGRFREDLYYRLNVIPLRIPPLRDRKEDIYHLAMHIVRRFNQDYGRSIQDISAGVQKRLLEYEWPGNIRELENFIGRAIINMKFNDTVILEEHLPRINEKAVGAPDVEGKAYTPDFVDASVPLNKVLDDTEKEYIKKVLHQVGYNKTEAARRMGISIRNLYYKLKKYRIDMQ